MSGFDGRISYDGDEDVANELVGLAVNRANVLRAWKEASGVRNLVRGITLRDGYYAVVADLEHMRTLHIHAPSDARLKAYSEYTPKVDPLKVLGVVDVVSGLVTNPFLVEETITVKEKVITIDSDGKEKVELKDKEVKVKAVKEFTATSDTAARYTNLFARRRLGVEMLPQYQESEYSYKYAQTSRFLPSDYSGAMREVIQLLLGVGKVLRPTGEEMWIAKSPKTRAKLLYEVLNKYKKDYGASALTSAFGLYSSKPEDVPVQTDGLQIDFDFSFSKTHGISFDKANKPWVIEISSRGVHAMPLYMDPMSLTEKGRERYLDVSPELDGFFNKFGGFPAGIAIPSGKMFTPMKKAGEIVELISQEDMEPFYTKSFFSPDIGWSFNSTGSQAHNTCVDIGSDGVQNGYHYKIDLKLEGDTLNDTPSKPDWTDDTIYIASVLPLKYSFEKNKARRLSSEQATGLVQSIKNQLTKSSPDLQAVYKDFQDLTVEPTLNATASLTLVRKGKLYHPAKPKGQPQIKFPWRMLGGLVSYDFGLFDVPGYVRPKSITCNTPMFVTFIDDNLEVVYYYYTTAPQKSLDGYSTRVECQYTGKWEFVEPGDGTTRVDGNFYSTTIDWRTSATNGTLFEQKVTGSQLGISDWYACPLGFTCVYSWKIRHFWYKTITTITASRYSRIAVAIPLNSRDMYYMGRFEMTSGKRIFGSEYGESVDTGIIQIYKIYNFIAHFIHCGEPTGDPAIHECVAQLVEPHHGQFPCYEGDVATFLSYSVCGGMYGNDPIIVSSPAGNAILGSVMIPPIYPPPGRDYPILDDGFEFKARVRVVSADFGSFDTINESMETTTKKIMDDGWALVSYFDQYARYKMGMSEWWFDPSPNDNGNYAYLSAFRNCLGTKLLNYMKDIGKLPYESKGVLSDMWAPDGGTYVGVIK